MAGVAGGRWQWLYGGWWQVNTDRRKAEPRRPRQNKRDNLTHPIGPIPIPSIAAPQHRHSTLHSPPSPPSTPLHSAPSGRLQASRQSTSASLTAYHTIHRHRLFRPAAVAVAALLSSPSLSSPRWVFRRSAPENTNPQCARAWSRTRSARDRLARARMSHYLPSQSANPQTLRDDSNSTLTLHRDFKNLARSRREEVRREGDQAGPDSMFALEHPEAPFCAWAQDTSRHSAPRAVASATSIRAVASAFGRLSR